MRISFERTGGFAGISKKTTVDTAQLPANEANTLNRLVEAADLFRLPEQITSPNPQSDRFQYKLTVEDNGNGKQHTVTVSEAALPGTLRPLIEWLQNIAQKK
ncbi:MAG: protealysin inhibitor emfourin [Nostoc sp.]